MRILVVEDDKGTVRFIHHGQAVSAGQGWVFIYAKGSRRFMGDQSQPQETKQ